MAVNGFLTDDPLQPPATAVAIQADRFRSLMSLFPTGVAVVTAMDQHGRPWGMTCSSVCSVTVTPPILLVCLREASPTLDAVLRLGTFTVNLLHDRARPVAELFASGTPDRFDRVRWCSELFFGGPHLLDDAHAIADCQVTQTVRVGDHVVVFGEVFRVERQAPAKAKPLLYGLRRYSSWPSAR